MESGDIPKIMESNSYIRNLYTHTGLHIKQEGKILARWQDSRELALLQLFLATLPSNAVHCWLCTRLAKKGTVKMTFKKFNAHLVLEIATSLVNFNMLAEYWCGDMFTEHPDFKAVMSRNDFNLIQKTFYSAQRRS